MTDISFEAIVNAAIYNFCAHLATRPAPMIVGEGYPRELLIQQIIDWCRYYGLDPEVAVSDFTEIVRLPEFKEKL